ncbi:MAG: exo-beta-N-acetylmuramidase NamZ domain-containing protein [Chitinophagales bacterium]|jgi:uncharacterized protein YbbC (DUF1343 family)
MLRSYFIFLLFLFQQQSLLAQNPLPGAVAIHDYLPKLEKKRVALVVNHTAQVNGKHLVDTLQSLGVDIRFVFAPEHGFRGLAGAGDLLNDTIDEQSCLPIRSLYGKNKKPKAEQLQEVDIVVYDIQDVGARFYTYISTLFYVAEACAENEKQLIVLDRPNPNGHYIDGPVLDLNYRSFVGIVPIPIVHGCTVGELALMYKGESWINCADFLDLLIIPCSNYQHAQLYAPPIKPSPNLPDLRSILLYPSLCLFEGTKVSVGRGTNSPFQILGYPEFPAGSCFFKPAPNQGAAKPSYNEIICCGVDLSNTPIDVLYQKKSLDLSWLFFFFENSPIKDDFFNSNQFFNLLAGNQTLRIQLEQGCSEEEIRASWWPGIVQFRKMRDNYLLYPE